MFGVLVSLCFKAKRHNMKERTSPPPFFVPLSSKRHLFPPDVSFSFYIIIDFSVDNFFIWFINWKWIKDKIMLRFGNLRVRQAQETDVQQLVSWWNDGNIMAHAGFPKGVGTNTECVSNLLKKDAFGKVEHFMLEFDSRSVGEMHYRQTDECSVEIGIKICDFAFHRQGLGKKFLSLFINYLFEVFHYAQIVVHVDCNNMVARHVYEQLGFKQISTDREKNERTYSLIQSDFINYLI